MTNDYIADSIKSNSVIVKFFYNLLKTKPPRWKTATDKERLKYLAKYYFALCFFKLGISYHSFIGLLTKHYPFSLLYQDRMFHHDNLKINNLMMRMEKLAKKAGVNINIFSGYQENNMTELIGHLDKRTKNRSNALTALETALQKKYETVYVRDDGETVRILIPTSTFEEIICRRLN